jgi:hypothetical protein
MLARLFEFITVRLSPVTAAAAAPEAPGAVAVAVITLRCMSGVG